MAVAIVHAPAERGHAGGFGQRQAGSFEAGATLKPLDRPRTWPERVMERNASSKPPQARIGRRTRSRPSDCARQREFGRLSGRSKDASGQERKPDAGASAGEQSRCEGSQDRTRRGQTSGAKHAPPKQARRKVRRKSARPNGQAERDVHTPVRVGSAAMPAPFALGLPLRLPKAISRVAARKTAWCAGPRTCVSPQKPRN